MHILRPLLGLIFAGLLTAAIFLPAHYLMQPTPVLVPVEYVVKLEQGDEDQP